MKAITQLSIVVFTSLLMFGCASAPPTTEIFPNTQQNTQLTQWELEGRIGIRTSTEGFSANIHWQQCDENFLIQLSGPLGLGAVKIYGNQQSISIESNEGTQYFDRNSQALEQALGFTLPFDELFYWIKALPQPNTAFESHPTGFTQSDWQLDYSNWQTLENYQLPEKIKLQSLQNIQTKRIMLKINNWLNASNCSNLSY